MTRTWKLESLRQELDWSPDFALDAGDQGTTEPNSTAPGPVNRAGNLTDTFPWVQGARSFPNYVASPTAK